MEQYIPEELISLTHADPEKKPEIRWWLAGGSHTDKTLLESLDDICAMGFGGIEVLTMAESAMDRSKFGWDSAAWYQSTKTLLEQCNNRGLAFSFTSGPNWQPAVPGLDLDGNAAAQELNFNAFTVPPCATTQGALVPYKLSQDSDHTPVRAQHFICAVAVRLAVQSSGASIDLSSARHPGLFPMPGSDFDTVYLDGDTAVDLTPLVHTVGDAHFLTWTAPADGTYVVFSFWFHSTAQQAMASFAPAYVINHIHRDGFEAQKRYWEKHFFTPEMCKLIHENRKVNFFQDSLEINTSQYSNLFWSPDFMDEFYHRRGYELTLLLPMVIQYNIGFVTNWLTRTAHTPRFLYCGWEEKRDLLMHDIYQTQTELYMENYLTPIRQWLNSHGIQLRAQTSYGFPTVSFEVSQPISCVDIHETETLEMADEVDYYRTQSGGVHLTGKNVFSAESGATNGGSYYLSPQDYLDKYHKLFAGGVNHLILHGYAAIAGPEKAVKWPGYEALSFDTSERWGCRHPYGADMPILTGYLNRMQTLLQQGTPKMDIGILNLSYTSVNMDFWYGAIDDPAAHRSDVFAWADRHLNDGGYTYEFFAPQYLEDTALSSHNGLFDSGRTDYRALVVNQQMLPRNSLKALVTLAQDGIPVVLLKDAGASPAFLQEDGKEIKELRNLLLSFPNTAVAENQSDIINALKKLGVTPRAAYSTPAPLMQIRREVGTSGIQFIYNPTNNTVNTTVIFENQIIPYQYDAWSGKIFPVPARYQENQTLVDVSMHRKTAIVLLTSPGTAKAATRRLIPISLPVGPWDLTAELWSPGALHHRRQSDRIGERDEVYFDTEKRIVVLSLQKLSPWKDIPELGSGASGIGVYRTQFTLPETWDGQTLMVDFGHICGIISGCVNGIPMDSMDLNHPQCNITALVHPGANQLQVKISSTLCNQLISLGRMSPGSTILKELKVEVSSYGLTDLTFYTE